MQIIKLLYSIIISLMLTLTLVVELVNPQATFAKNAFKDQSELSRQALVLEDVPDMISDKELKPKAAESLNAEQTKTEVKTAPTASSKSKTTTKIASTSPTQRATSTPAPSRQTAPKTTTKATSTKTASATSTTTTKSTTTSKAASIIHTAKQYIGVKYVWGGTTPSGFDCSGYMKYVYAKHGITLPRVSRDQYNVGQPVSYSNLKPADLVFFSLDGDKVTDHVGMYIGGGQFIHASSTKGVTISTMSSYWKSKYLGARRVL